MDQKVAFPWAARLTKQFGSGGPVTLAESILQVVLHTTHHRAQVVTRLRESNEEPPLNDFLAWTWMERPEPEWQDIETARPGDGPD